MNTRLGKVLSLQVGEDGLQPFHARGPDNPGGTSLSLQPHFLSQLCKHGITLHDECDTCQNGTTYRTTPTMKSLPQNIRVKIDKKILAVREIEDAANYFARLRVLH